MAGLLAVTFLVLLWGVIFDAPKYFPVGETITIPQGVSTGEIAQLLYEADVIESKKLYTNLTRVFFNANKVKAGDYFFSNKVGPLIVAYRVAKGVHGVEPLSITFSEGLTIREMAESVAIAFPHISSEEFKKEAKGLEGYLFPNTYSFLPNASAQTIINTMHNEFEQQIKTLREELNFDAPLSDIVIMASILEREARQFETKREVSGVLWNRIEIGMALQVDAVFGYIFGRSTYHPSLEDLEIDSPYNTYKNRGLPPGPISNPGIDSLRAAADPAETNYFFYLTGRDGVMHYAETFDGHRRNRSLYLD
ncbi:endolytic transglycosylase MltG [Candidatus Wolfebacteria bacterium]|nr:endolytic transglycosylase MltG [Candidatus Wolfebacteria bacterium]